MFSTNGAQPISLKSFRGLGHFPNKIAHIEYDLVGYIPVDELPKAEQA